MDALIGRILQALDENDLASNTLIVYTSDHGESFREHWQLGHTSSLYEEEIHVPAWIHAPPGTLGESEQAADHAESLAGSAPVCIRTRCPSPTSTSSPALPAVQPKGAGHSSGLRAAPSSTAARSSRRSPRAWAWMR